MKNNYWTDSTRICRNSNKNLFCSQSSLLISPSLVFIELVIAIAPTIFLSVLQFSSLKTNQDFPNIFHRSLSSLGRTFYPSAFIPKKQVQRGVLSLLKDNGEGTYLYKLHQARTTFYPCVSRGLEYGQRPKAEGRTQDQGHSFFPYGPT